MGPTGFGWLKTGSGGRLLWTRWWNYGFHTERRLFFHKPSNYQFFKEYPAPWINWV